MSRNLTADTLKRIEAHSGEDPMCLIKLILNTGTFWFADRTVDGNGVQASGDVMDIGDLVTSVRIDSSSRILGTVGVITVRLIDDELVLKGLLDTNNFQGAQAEVYHWYAGQTAADLVLLMKGKIESAPAWHEEDRTLEITVETPRRDDVIPFTPKEADELDIHEDALGITWPMVFGQPRDVPAVRVKWSPQGTLVADVEQDATTFEIDDPDDLFPEDEDVMILVGDEYMTGRFDGDTFTVIDRQVNKYTGLGVSGTGAVVTVPEGCRVIGQYLTFRSTSVPVDSNYNAMYTVIGGIQEPAVGSIIAGTLGGSKPNPNATIIYRGYCYKQKGTKAYIWAGNPDISLANTVMDVNRYPFSPDDGAEWTHGGGTPVILVQKYAEVWIANQLPSTSVTRVAAYKQISDADTGYTKRKLVVVPESMYTVNLSDSNFLGATTIKLNEPLSAKNSGWEDKLYVTLVSTKGSNTADIVKYLIDDFSGMSADADSFAETAEKLEKYPSHFAILEAGDVMEVAGSIAWQARCGLALTGSTVRMVYLSEEPVGQAIGLGDGNVEEGSLGLGQTAIEDVVTYFRANWKRSYADEDDKKLVFNENSDLYGKRERTFDFWIYQHKGLVRKSARWHARRRARIWRTAQARLWGNEGIAVDALDYARWDTTDIVPQVRGLVTSVTLGYDWGAIECLLPVEAGTSVQSQYFWESDDDDVRPNDPQVGLAAEDEADEIEVPPPQVTVPGEFESNVYSVVATADEITDAASTTWKTVEVRIMDSDEVAARSSRAANLAQIDQLYALNAENATRDRADWELPDNSTVRDQYQELYDTNLDLDAQIQTKVDHPTIVTARNPGVQYMLTGDEGTMIKIPGGQYIVTPANSTGPFIFKVSKPPASPAEGKLYGNVATTIQGSQRDPVPVEVLGETSGIKENDLLLVFRDATGTYYTQGGGGSGAVAIGQCAALTDGTTAVSLKLWLRSVPPADPDLTAVGKAPGLVQGAKIPAGYWAPAMKVGETWYFFPAIYYDYTG